MAPKIPAITPTTAPNTPAISPNNPPIIPIQKGNVMMSKMKISIPEFDEDLVVMTVIFLRPAIPEQESFRSKKPSKRLKNEVLYLKRCIIMNSSDKTEQFRWSLGSSRELIPRDQKNLYSGFHS